MKYLLLSFLVLLELGSLSAQSFVGKLTPYPATVERTALADDTLKILAVMVSFQQDADGTTSGNGKFGTIYSQNYGSDILDPLPHDKRYFESHLLFVKNYFAKVSKGILAIEYTVLPDTFSVTDRMRNYSPDPGSDDFTPLADFSVEAWTKADQLYPGFAFSDYDVFLIFHAGVGRDISLPGSIGNERDLPSVYLSDNAFKEIYGETYEGIPVSGGSFKITNSMIIPETESRELETISGTFLFEISINGLMCASIGSHLGLPDLFDTETGLSAIGRFGLMDGQSIFAYLGTYPPEPSPWEKITLGWAEPVTMEIQNADVSLVTSLAASISDTVILKVHLNSSEYYLVENRSRDAYNDGSTITYAIGDIVITKTFSNDTTGYRSFDVDSLSGVVVDVDEFDWAVPGNGIVIWHIDENVINEKIAENKVNTDKNRRGVDVEEADGVQDIGERFFTIFGDEVIGEGTEYDFWHSDNPSELFQNRFAKDTRPNTLTNTGANSLITIKDFSEIDNRMNFIVEFGDSVVKQVFSTKIDLDGFPEQFFSSIEFQNEIYFVIGEFVEGFTNLKIITKDSVVAVLDRFSVFKPAVLSQNNELHIYGNRNNHLNYWIFDGSQANIGSITLTDTISFPIVASTLQNQAKELVFGTRNGKIFWYNLASSGGIQPVKKDSVYFGQQFVITGLVCNGDFYAAISGENLLHTISGQPYYFSSEGNHDFEGEPPQKLLLTKDQAGNFISIVATTHDNIYTISDGNILSQFQISPTFPQKKISLGDLRHDGNIYIVSNALNAIEVYNLSGALLDNFPYGQIPPYPFPLIADIEGDNNSEIITPTSEGHGILAINSGNGKTISGFPFAIDEYLTIDPLLFIYNGKINLATLSKIDEYFYELKAWSISSVEGKLYWSEEFGNPQNTSFVDAAENTNRINEFFPESRAYNYPNPVYEGTTNIRYYVAEDSKINIKIFDLAGDFVAELNDEAQGGMDNETVWNVGDIQSGVYLARIEAVCDCGNTEQAVIKIAVVK